MFIYIRAHMYICVYIYWCIHVYIHTITYVNIHMYVHICMYLHPCTRTNTRAFVSIRTSTHKHTANICMQQQTLSVCVLKLNSFRIECLLYLCVCRNWSLLKFIFLAHSILCTTPRIDKSCQAWILDLTYVYINWGSRTPGSIDGLLWFRDRRVKSLMHATLWMRHVTYECVQELRSFTLSTDPLRDGRDFLGSWLMRCSWRLCPRRGPSRCVCVWERERQRERESVCVCLCVCVCCVCVCCVCVSVLVWAYFTEYPRTPLSKRAQTHAEYFCCVLKYVHMFNMHTRKNMNKCLLYVYVYTYI